MNGYKRVVIAIMTMALLLSLSTSGNAKEPTKPDVGKMFDVQTEAKISRLAGLSIFEAFEQLKGDEYQTNADLKYKAVHKAFHFRKTETLTFALSYLRMPLIEVVSGKVISEAKGFNNARRIFETFPEDATPMLVSLYEQGDAVTKGNVIRVIGNVADGQEIKRLLVQALDDTSVYEEEIPDVVGYPLRVCDVAYNQLVLRYNIRNVLRNISPGHRPEIRDYHIGILKGML